jgi:putative DNA primase/helicase
MSRVAFNPLGVGKRLEASGNYGVYDGRIAVWDGAAWGLMSKDDGHRLTFADILSHEGENMASSTNAMRAYSTALLYIQQLGEPTRLPVIPVRNGYVHLSSSGASLQAHDKELNLRYAVKCDYDPMTPAPAAFMKFLERILPNQELRDRVQEYIGYTMLPDAPHQIAQFWLGSGANGKGVLANIVQALHRKVAAVNLDDLDDFALTEVLDASLIYCDEAPQERIKDRTFKMVTAAETVPVKRKYRDPISARIRGKWLILGNHLPEITDHSEGFWRRLDIIPFSVTIPPAERDPNLAQHIIRHELAGVLQWAIEGALRLLTRGRFDPVLPQAMLDALSTAKTESNTVLSWWQDTEQAIKVSVDTLKMDVYHCYSSWCKAHGHTSVVPMPKFWKRLTAVVPNILEGRITTPSGRPRVCNIALRTF